MASVTSICNRALQLLGAARILGITDDTRNGRACNAAYAPVRRAELRRHRWLFAIKRVVLSPLVEEDPLEEYEYIFQLPGDCVRVLKPRDPYLDWKIEGQKLYTNQSNELQLRYIADIEDPNLFDPLFAEAISCKMAEAMCEEITQSNTKKAVAKEDYKDIIADARKTNAMESVPAEPEEDSWLLVRR